MELEDSIHRIQQGDIQAFERIVDEYKNKIFALAYGYTRDQHMAQDLSQEIFIKVYQNIPSFQGQSSFSTWLYRVGKNCCIDWIRKNRRRMENTILEDGEREYVDDGQNPEEDAILNERKEMLYRAIQKLPEKYRTPLMLFHFQDLTYEEIGKVLKIPTKTVATQLYRGKRMLRDELLSKGRGEMPWTALL